MHSLSHTEHLYSPLVYPDSPSNSPLHTSLTNLSASYNSYHNLLPPTPTPFYFTHQPQRPSESGPNPTHHTPSSRLNIAHPYARLYAKKDSSKRRKIWNHALEKLLFTPNELCTMGAPHRRTIYIASLEAHIDRLHAQMISLGFFPVDYEKLEPFRGLNSKTAKSMVSGLQHDISHTRLKLLELERANGNLHHMLAGPQQNQRHLADSFLYGYDH